MTLKLPFFNRKRYLVLKCYTNTKFHVDECPVTLSSALSSVMTRENKDRKTKSFSTCYGYVKGLKKSAVLPAWTEVEYEGHGNDVGVGYSWADTCEGASFIENQPDSFYNVPNATLTKLSPPWRVEESTGADFVAAKHIRNRTPMAIPSGIMQFKYQHQLNIFNVVSNNQPKYLIPFREPLLALYPMSGLPLHVECYYDEDKHMQLSHATLRRAYFRGNCLKRSKNNY